MEFQYLLTIISGAFSLLECQAETDSVLNIATLTLTPSFTQFYEEENAKIPTTNYSKMPNTVSISDGCKIDLMEYGRALESRQAWALRMWDASGKFPVPGAREGNFFALGSYDECLLHGTPNRAKYPATYCLVAIATQDHVFNPSQGYTEKILKAFRTDAPFFRALPGILFRIGWCVPSNCSPLDVETIVSQISKSIPSDDIIKLALATSFPSSGTEDLRVDEVVCTGVDGIPFRKDTLNPPKNKYESRNIEHYNTAKAEYTNERKRQIRINFNLATTFLFVSFAIVVIAHFVCRFYPTPGNGHSLGYRLLVCFDPGANVRKLIRGSDENGTESSAANYYFRNGVAVKTTLSNGHALAEENFGSNGIYSSEEPLPRDPIKILHGIRALSMMHAILAHTYVFSIFVIRNLAEVVGPAMFQDSYIVFLFSGFFAVDTFFFISGFLCAMNVAFPDPGQKVQGAKVDDSVNHNGSCHGPLSTGSRNGYAKQARLRFPKWTSGEPPECRLGPCDVIGSSDVAADTLPPVCKNRFLRKIEPLLLTYLYRYVRLTPLYLCLLVCEFNLLPHLFGRSGGPLKAISEVNEDNCKSMWWANLLYINNLVGTRRMCGIWTWYLANDVQFHVLAPFLLMPWARGNRSLGLRHFILTAILAVTVSCSFGISLSRGYRPGLFADDPKILDTFYDYYIKPIVRISPFILGIILGCMLRPLRNQAKSSSYNPNVNQNTDHKPEQPYRPNFFHFTMAAGSPLILILAYMSVAHFFQGSTSSLNLIAAALVNSMARVIWSCLIGGLIFDAFVWKRGKGLTHFLSHEAWLPISNLTYAAYLIHPLVIQSVNRNLRQPLYMTHTHFTALAAGYWLLSYALGFVFSLTFEVPAINFAKAFIRRSGASKHLRKHKEPRIA